MKTNTQHGRALSGLFASLVVAVIPASALSAPGEDPLILTKPVQHMELPLGNAAKSKGLETIEDMPTSIKAKVVRYEAKAFSGQHEGVYTDQDVTTKTDMQGLHKTCVQEIASNTAADASAFNRYGPNNQAQMVVLRGELINVCK